MNKIILSKENEILLNLLAKELFGYNAQIDLDSVELKDVFKEAKAQTVVALSFNSLPRDARKKDDETYSAWQQLSILIMQRTLNNNFANAKLTELLNNNGIKHCTLKGYASAYYYPNSSLRQMGDIDFLINKDCVTCTTDLLVENGFAGGHEETDLHIGFAKNKVLYEMHTSVTRVPEGKEFVLDEFDDLIDKSVEVNSARGKIVIPSKYHHGVVMLVHMQRHMTNGSGIGLRHLCDWAVFVNSVDNNEWVEIFEGSLKNIGLWKFAKAISKTSSIYLKMPQKPWFADADDELAKALIFDIFDGGNFGRKNSLRSTQRIMSDNKSKFKVFRIFKGSIIWIYEKYPICKKNKILLLPLYIGHYCKVLFKLLFKHANYNFTDVIKKGSEQFDTYEQLEFFVK